MDLFNVARDPITRLCDLPASVDSLLALAGLTVLHLTGEGAQQQVTMKLITAHKILISTAAVFFVFFSFWELRNYLSADNGWALSRSVLYLIIAIGFAVYFKNLHRFYK